jgi:hypothetical protein
MAVVTELLNALDLLNVPSATTPPPAARAVLSWPPNPLSVVEGPLTTTSGDLDKATSPRPRMVAFIGPETTVLGLGATVRGWLQTIPAPTAPIPDARTAARAILAYHKTDLALDKPLRPPPPAPGFSAWQVGRGVRLPIEVDSTGRLVTDLARWDSLAGSADLGWDAVLDWTPWTLDLPDHDADRQWATNRLANAADRSSLADDLRQILLTNPSNAVYRFLALLAVDKPNDPALQEQLWAALAGASLRADELSLLATTYPGAVALRSLYRRLGDLAARGAHAASVDQAIQSLNDALGLPSGTAPVDLNQNTPTAVPRELPVSQAWSRRPDQKRPTYDATGERSDGRHELVLGRSFYAGMWHNDNKYYGPAYGGNREYEVGRYVAAHRAEVFAGADATRTARLDIVAAIAPNEGFLDAVRLRDRAILSLGIQQWSVHVDDELNVLLFDFAESDPDDYDAHLGIYGLRLSRTDTWSGQPGGMPAGATRAATMFEAGPGTQSTPMPAPSPPPDNPPERLRYFGGVRDPAKPGYFRFDDTRWSGLVRSATRCSRALQLRELVMAADRFGRIRGEGRQWTVGSATFTIDQLITSVQGAAQLLDQHINVPGYLQADIKTAISKTNVTPGTDAQGNLTTAWLAAFEAAYLSVMRYGSGVKKTDTTLPNGQTLRGRQSFIVNQGLPAAPHTFQGW